MFDDNGVGADTLQQTLDSVGADSRRALQRADENLVLLQGLLGKDSPLLYRLNGTLDQIGEAARALHLLADYLERHPEALLHGKPGQRRE